MKTTVRLRQILSQPAARWPSLRMIREWRSSCSIPGMPDMGFLNLSHVTGRSTYSDRRRNSGDGRCRYRSRATL